MHKRISSFIEDLAAPRWLVGASVFRLLAGCAILLEYLLNYPQRRYLFGPSGAFPFQAFLEIAPTRRFSLYALSSSIGYFEIVFHLGLLLTLLWTLGVWTRVLTPLVWLFLTSLHDRFSPLWDGGDNAIEIVLIYMSFANVSAHLSLAPGSPPARDAAPRLRHTMAGLLHNAAVIATGIQASMIYVVAGLTKVQGDTWRSGTAIYHALSGGEFVWAGHVGFIFRNAFVLTLLCYATVGFQISFPFLMIMNRWTRLFAVAMAIVFHLGIMIFLTLWTFAAFLVAIDLALVGDDEYRLVGRGARAVGRRLAAPFASLRPAKGPAVPALPE